MEAYHLIQAALAIRGFAIHGFDYSNWNLVEPNPYLSSKPGLAICSFAVHIHNILEHNPYK